MGGAAGVVGGGGWGWLAVFRRRRRRRRHRRRRRRGGPKFYEKHIFSGWVCLVGKTFPDRVGVFCGMPGLLSGHIGQKSIFWGNIGVPPLTPIGPFKGPVCGYLSGVCASCVRALGHIHGTWNVFRSLLAEIWLAVAWI